MLWLLDSETRSSGSALLMTTLLPQVPPTWDAPVNESDYRVCFLIARMPNALPNASNPQSMMSGEELAVVGSSAGYFGAAAAVAVAAGAGSVWITWATSTSSPVGLTAMMGACCRTATTAGSSGFSTSTATSAWRAGTGTLVTLANSTALAFGYTNSSPQ